MAEDHLKGIAECPDCASQNIVHGTMRDQIICRDCGLIFEPLAPAGPVRKPVRKKAAARKAVARAAKKAARRPRKRKQRQRKPKPAHKKKKKWLWW